MVASMDDVLPPPASAIASEASASLHGKPKRARRVATLLLDNYDSYTYNIAQMLAQVNGDADSVVVFKNDDFDGQWPTAWSAFLAKVHAQGDDEEDVAYEYNVVISPGPGHPAEPRDFGMCADAIRSASVPVLGVCLGHQGLAHVHGGHVVEADEVMHGRTSRVFFDVDEKEDALFAYVPNGFEVVRYHSLVIDPQRMPKELTVLARTTDGVIMAVRHRSKPQFGVQFHPEAVCSQFGYQLFQNFRDLTLHQRASPCLLQHSDHRDGGGSASSKPEMQRRDGQETEPASYQVLVQRASRGLASLAFAEFAFSELFAASKRSFWLDSSNYDTVAASEAAAQSRISMMGDDSGPMSYCVEFDVAQNELRLRRRRYEAGVESEQVDIHPGQDILIHVREVMQAHQAHDVVLLDDQEAAGDGGETEPSLLPFAFRGGFVGYFGYEVLGSEQQETKDESLEKLESAPDASFLFADRTLVFDHQEGVIYSLSLSKTGESEQASRLWHATMSHRVKQLAEAFHLMTAVDSLQTPQSLVNVGSPTEGVVFRPSRSRAQYVADIEEIQRLIRAGETYEVCLTNHLRAEYAIQDPLGFYRMLRRRNPAPFAGFYLSNPMACFQSAGDSEESSSEEGSTTRNETYALCCSSPERFLRVTHDGWMESKPIKGTRPRGRDPSEDAAIATELKVCEKDRAENMMIADLVRNDFGIVARVGSVHVPRLMSVETYATVHQLVTTVRAQRRDDADVVDVLRATFPGGSMTGAPKKRTMHIIRQLERAPRGVYSGALGFLSIDGSCDLNIIIRTAVVTPHAVTLGAGGAIVALSDSDDEYDEMLLKARALVATVGVFATGRHDGSGARVEVEA